MNRFKFGILEDVLQSDWVDVFPKAKALGYDGVELGVRGNTYRTSDLWNEEGIEALGQRAESAGVPIFSVCLHTFWHYSFADPDVANRFMAKQIVFQAIHACTVLDVKTILIPVTNPMALPPRRSRPSMGLRNPRRRLSGGRNGHSHRPGECRTEPYCHGRTIEGTR